MHQPRNKSPRSLPVTKYNLAPKSTDDNPQHGPDSYILAIPAEALGHITAYLEPPALLALAQVNRQLLDHVASDTVWLRAFLVFFLDIGPEIAVDSLLQSIPRLKLTWRDEYIARFKLVRRWQRSRAPTVTHAPQWAPITMIHLMVDGAALLSASALQGVISRSHILTGKKFKGFINSYGQLVQRPTGDHPLPSVVELTSDGGTGKTAWGFFSGDVAFTRMPHVMDLGAPRHSMCRPEDAHAGAVSCLQFSPGGHLLASAAADGTVKLWGTRHLRCLWTYTPTTALDERDACVRLVLHVPSGTITAAMQSGQIVIWTGFEIDPTGETCGSENVRMTAIPSPPALDADVAQFTKRNVTALLLDPTSAPTPALAVLYEGESCVRRIAVAGDDLAVHDIATSAVNSQGLLTCLRASSSSTSRPFFLVSGDKAGWLQTWDWPNLQSLRSWSAHEDGSITALEVTDNVIASGSSGGSIFVWDALNFQLLRSFTTPVPRNLAQVGGTDVAHLIVSDSHVVGSVGNRVVAWRVDRRIPLGLAAKGKNKGGGTARYISPKWQGQIEMKKAIAESFDVIDTEQASSSARAAYGGRAREQRTALDELGLEENEALEYVLMLSRDEEERRQRQLLGSSLESTSSIASGTSEPLSDRSGDFSRVDSDTSISPRGSVHEEDLGQDEIFSMTPIPTPPSSPPLTAWSSRRSSNASSAQPRAMPTNSNRKVQVTPPFRPEAVEAGTSPSAFSLDGAIPVPRKSDRRDSDFPSISASPSPSNRWAGSLPKSELIRASPRQQSSSPALNQVGAGVSNSKPSSASGSPPKSGRAWSSVVRASGVTVESATPARSGRVATQRPSMVPQNADDEEEMLRLALEASLSEI